MSFFLVLPNWNLHQNSNMENNSNFEADERKAARKATRALTTSIRSVTKSTFNRVSGDMEESRVASRFRDARLDRLVMTAPHYSFKWHFGSSKSGVTKTQQRSPGDVKSFVRHLNGKSVQVNAHNRAGGSVSAHVKNINYKGRNHIADALNATNALETLATDLGENRIVDITSQIDFK